GIIQTGFSQASNIVPTLDNGLTFRASLFSPFADGVTPPPGASQGLATFLGRDIVFLPNAIQNPQTQRWEFSVQRELPGNWLVEASYVGNRGYNVVNTDPSTINFVNAIPRQYLSTSLSRDNTTNNFLTALVTNPLRNLLPGTGNN